MNFKKLSEQSIRLFYSIVFFICSFFILFHFEKYPLGFNHSIIKVLLFAIISAFTVFSYEKVFHGNTSVKANIIRGAIAFILIIIQVLLFLKILSPVGWDAFEVNNSAIYGLYNGDYFARYPNNLFMQILLSNWLKLLSFTEFISPLRKMELLNLLFVDIAIGMAVFVVKELYGMRAADRVFICSVLLIGFHPTLSVIYSDTLAMPFPIGVLLCVIYGWKQNVKWKQILHMLAAGSLGIIGFHIKPTVIIIDIAIIILFFLHWQKEYLQKHIPLLIICFVLGIILTNGLISAIKQPVKAEIQKHYPDIVSVGLLHYIGLGLSNLDDDPSGYGGWNEPEVTWTQQHINNPNYNHEALQHIADRISAYGAVGYLEQLLNKLIWAGSDGTFFYGLEGDFHLEEQCPQNTSKGFLQNAFYIETDFYQNWLSSWFQGVWLMICVRSALSMFHKSDNPFGSIARLSVLGLFLFLLLFENRSRYLFLYLPVLLVALESELFIPQRKNNKIFLLGHR